MNFPAYTVENLDPGCRLDSTLRYQQEKDLFETIAEAEASLAATVPA